MALLYEDIVKCKGIGRCYGKATGRIDPVVFPAKPTMRKMVVTEQAGEPKEKLMERIRGRAFSKNGTPSRLDGLLDGRFFDGIEDGTIYWTHFIKCPGKIKTAPKGCEIDACANWLLREIEAIGPDVVIAVPQAGKFLLRKSRWEKNWFDYFWMQVESVVKGEAMQYVRLNQARIVVLCHPSGRSNLPRLNEKVKPLLDC